MTQTHEIKKIKPTFLNRLSTQTAVMTRIFPKTVARMIAMDMRVRYISPRLSIPVATWSSSSDSSKVMLPVTVDDIIIQPHV